ncbi:MAG: hypothetical protein AAB408_04700 [Patescibacteria group bacterium]
MASYDKFQDFEVLASQFRTYDGAWNAVLTFVAPIHDVMLTYMFPFVLGFSFLTMSYHSLRLRPQDAAKWFMFLIFASAMLYTVPVQVTPSYDYSDKSAQTLSSINKKGGGGGAPAEANISLAFYLVNYWMDRIANTMMDAVDAGIGKFGDDRDFQAPQLASAQLQRGYDKLLANTNADKLITAFKDKCQSLASSVDKVGRYSGRNAADAIGLLPQGVPRPVVKDADKFVDLPKDNSLRKLLESYPPGGFSKRDGYHIETNEYWRNRLGGDEISGNGSFVRNFSGTNLNFSSSSDDKSGNEKSAEEDKAYPKNCYEMYQAAEFAFRQFAYAARDKVIGSEQRLYDSRSECEFVVAKDDSYCPGAEEHTKVRFIALQKAIYSAYYSKVNRHDPNAPGSNLAAATLASTAQSLFSWFTEAHATLYGLFFPAVISLMTGVLMILFPVVIVLSVFPGREATIPTALLSLVFLKLTLVLTYFIIKLGGLVATAAIIRLSRDGFSPSDANDALWGIAAGTNVLTFLCALIGAPALAYIITFNDKGGIRSLGFDSFGARQMTSAGMRAAGVATGLAFGASKLGKSVGKMLSDPPLKPPGGPGGLVSGQPPSGRATPTMNNIKALLSKNLWKP